jgi:hypothetical protein
MEIKTSYTLPIEQDGDDLILSFPDALMESVGWEVGDQVVWTENGDGSWTLSKVVKDESNI